MTSRRVRGPAAHRAAGGEPPLASRGLQNSQRVLHAKPRTAPMARRRDGDIAPYRQAARGVRTATGHERCARQRGTGVEHRNGAREVRTTKPHGEGARCEAAHRGGEPPRAMARRREPGGWGIPTGGCGQASRPTAKPHGEGARAMARQGGGRCEGRKASLVLRKKKKTGIRCRMPVERVIGSTWTKGYSVQVPIHLFAPRVNRRSPDQPLPRNRSRGATERRLPGEAA